MGFGLLLLYVGLMFFRPMEWVPGLAQLDIMLTLAVLAIIVTLFTIKGSEWRMMDAPQNWMVFGFFVACLMSHASHLYRAMFVETFLDFGKIVLVYYLISINVTTLKRLRLLIGVMTGGAVFMAVHGILQWHRGVGFGGQLPMYLPFYDETRVLAFGIFNDPNDLALILVTMLPFVINTVHRPNVMFPRRVLNAAFAAAMLYCIFRTNSRGGWLALGVMVIVYFLANFARKKLAVGVAVAALAALAVAAPSRMGTATTREGSARGRLIAWADGNRMLKRAPLFGAGTGRFKEFSEEGRVAHNSYVHCYAEVGLFGYVFWMGLLLASLKDLYAMGRPRGAVSEEQAEIGRIARICIAVLFGYMASAFFLSRTYLPPLYILFGIFAALRTMHQRMVGPIPNGFETRHFKKVIVVSLLSIPAIYLYLRLAI